MNFPDFLSNRRKTETLLDRFQNKNSKSQCKLTFKPGLFGKSKGSQPVIELYKEGVPRENDFKSPKASIRKEVKSKDVNEPRNVCRKSSFVASNVFFKKQKSHSKVQADSNARSSIVCNKLKDLCSVERNSKKSFSKIQSREIAGITKEQLLDNKKNSKSALKGKFFNTINMEPVKKNSVIKQKRLNIDRSPRTTECTKTLSFSKKKHTINVNSLVDSSNNQATIKDFNLVNPVLKAKLKNLELRLLNTLTNQKRGFE